MFTCNSAYIEKSAQCPFYFMPIDAQQRPQPLALKIISYTSTDSENFSPSIFSFALPSAFFHAKVCIGVEKHQTLQNEASVNKLSRAKELWAKVRAYSDARSKLFTPVYPKASTFRHGNEHIRHWKGFLKLFLIPFYSFSFFSFLFLVFSF